MSYPRRLEIGTPAPEWLELVRTWPVLDGYLNKECRGWVREDTPLGANVVLVVEWDAGRWWWWTTDEPMRARTTAHRLPIHRDTKLLVLAERFEDARRECQLLGLDKRHAMVPEVVTRRAMGTRFAWVRYVARHLPPTPSYEMHQALEHLRAREAHITTRSTIRHHQTHNQQPNTPPNTGDTPT